MQQIQQVDKPSDIDYRLRLLSCAHIGAQTYMKLIDYFGSAEYSLQANDAELQKLGINKRQIASINENRQLDVEPTLQWLESPENHILFSDQDNYPQSLKNLYDPPPLLFAKGDWQLLNDPQVGIVGSRNATGAGKQNAFEFAASLARHGITVTSGLAGGIDTQAHQGALSHRGGKTIAVVATGLDRVYPASNKQLAEQVVDQGLIISEFMLGTKPLPGHFPKRNRIISGLSLGTLVVEAAAQSGSLITAKHAMEQGKEVFAIPGSIHSPVSKGCHQLIRQGAKLVETVDDIMFDLQAQLRPFIEKSLKHSAVKSNNDSEADTDTAALDDEQQTLLNAIDYEPTAPDQIVERTGFEAQKISSMLLILELNDLVRSDQGYYTRIK